MRRDGGDARAPSLCYRMCRKNSFARARNFPTRYHAGELTDQGLKGVKDVPNRQDKSRETVRSDFPRRRLREPSGITPATMPRMISLIIDVRLLTRHAEEQQPCPPQRRRYSPAGRLLIGAPLGAELLLMGAELPSILVRHAVRIGKQSHRPIDIEVRPEALGEPLDGVERNIVQRVQLTDDDGLDQLIDADGATWRLIILLVVHLVNEVPSEQDIYCRRPAYGILLGNRL